MEKKRIKEDYSSRSAKISACLLFTGSGSLSQKEAENSTTLHGGECFTTPVH